MISIVEIARAFAAVAPACDEWSIRLVRRRNETLSVTRGTTDPIWRGEDGGAMISVTASFGGQTGVGYAATCDLTPAGLKRAGEEAMAWARRSAGHLIAAPKPQANARHYDHIATAAIPWDSVTAADKNAPLHGLARSTKCDERITH